MFDSLLEILKTFGLYFIQILIAIPCALVVVLVHNYIKSLVAFAFARKSSKEAGVISLNPLNSIEPIGFLCLALFRFGWSSSISFSKKDFKRPKLAAFVSIATSFFANFLLSFVFAFFLILVYPGATPLFSHIFNAFTTVLGENVGNFIFSLLQNALQTMCVLNLTFIVFNLIPLPPLEGFTILSLFIPKYTSKSIIRYEKYFMLAFLVILLLDYYFIGIITPALGNGVNFVLNKCFTPLFLKLFN